jgi:hypothetical protein
MLTAAVVALVCASILCVAACGVAGTETDVATATTATAETVRLYPVEVDGKWGYIDRKGDWVIEPRFDAVSPFSQGLAAVMLLQDYDGISDFETKGYVDRTGAIVVPLQYSEASEFSGGIARVVFRDAQSGAPSYIDKTGKVIWQGE